MTFLDFVLDQLPGFAMGLLFAALAVCVAELIDLRRRRPKRPADHLDISPAIARARRAARRKR